MRALSALDYRKIRHIRWFWCDNFRNFGKLQNVKKVQNIRATMVRQQKNMKNYQFLSNLRQSQLQLKKSSFFIAAELLVRFVSKTLKNRSLQGRNLCDSRPAKSYGPRFRSKWGPFRSIFIENEAHVLCPSKIKNPSKSHEKQAKQAHVQKCANLLKTAIIAKTGPF